MFDEDLGIFFNPHEFAVEALIQGHSIAGYLSNVYPTLHDPSTTSAHHFNFLCVAKDIASVSSGAVVVIEKNRYQLIGIQRDETGLATLTLLLIEKWVCR